MPEPSFAEFIASRGRISLLMRGRRIGRDLLVELFGGDAHIGAIALAWPGSRGNALSSPGHREQELASRIASLLANSLACDVAVVAGIHYDCITKGEIEAVTGLSLELTESLATALAQERQC